MLDASALSDGQLVEMIGADKPPPRAVVDEYYRRCIPLYLSFLGIHWHTGFYRDNDAEASPADQVRMIDHIADSIDLSRNERVLDVGCGVGATLCLGERSCPARLHHGRDLPGCRDIPAELEQQRVPHGEGEYTSKVVQCGGLLRWEGH